MFIGTFAFLVRTAVAGKLAHRRRRQCNLSGPDLLFLCLRRRSSFSRRLKGELSLGAYALQLFIMARHLGV